jgi:hypothetical protein
LVAWLPKRIRVGASRGPMVSGWKSLLCMDIV